MSGQLSPILRAVEDAWLAWIATRAQRPGAPYTTDTARTALHVAFLEGAKAGARIVGCPIGEPHAAQAKTET